MIKERGTREGTTEHRIKGSETAYKNDGDNYGGDIDIEVREQNGTKGDMRGKTRDI